MEQERGGLMPVGTPRMEKLVRELFHELDREFNAELLKRLTEARKSGGKRVTKKARKKGTR
jgi:hypothetical protein